MDGLKAKVTYERTLEKDSPNHLVGSRSHSIHVKANAYMEANVYHKDKSLLKKLAFCIRPVFRIRCEHPCKNSVSSDIV